MFRSKTITIRTKIHQLGTRPYTGTIPLWYWYAVQYGTGPAYRVLVWYEIPYHYSTSMIQHAPYQAIWGGMADYKEDILECLVNKVCMS